MLARAVSKTKPSVQMVLLYPDSSVRIPPREATSRSILTSAQTSVSASRCLNIWQVEVFSDGLSRVFIQDSTLSCSVDMGLVRKTGWGLGIPSQCGGIVRAFVTALGGTPTSSCLVDNFKDEAAGPAVLPLKSHSLSDGWSDSLSSLLPVKASARWRLLPIPSWSVRTRRRFAGGWTAHASVGSWMGGYRFGKSSGGHVATRQKHLTSKGLQYVLQIARFTAASNCPSRRSSTERSLTMCLYHISTPKSSAMY
mmetsp:Transcript_77603/g.161250  ORF Transcript_77603/g.161250 Transcript_77603/m.161250 type:complete len:253 (-) Transcript_77603:524-1282(-)